MAKATSDYLEEEYVDLDWNELPKDQSMKSTHDEKLPTPSALKKRKITHHEETEGSGDLSKTITAVEEDEDEDEEGSGDFGLRPPYHIPHDHHEGKHHGSGRFGKKKKLLN